ncbi:hypothetical protein KQI77_00045 [Clostridium sp. MSJ-8]|uniref:Tn7-like element transposition protein TnsE n=1 Tax=Clostridium sp. MSJ-8 TaxID=2841510 RepID=UPI001C0F13EF|nr:Tn7-like element transposition protein TnsE [Clostridium sp. MSJ-8]MBU5486565.1 hypothetical protein [Clostridium sp. MSJ-8]
MGRMQLKLKNWPFDKGKKVQLIWLGEPFKYNSKYMIDTYFNDGKVTKRIVQDWANIHFLSIDKFYMDGDLNSGEVIDKYGVIETIDIDLNNVMPKYNENDWRIKDSSYKGKSRTFNFNKNGKIYSVPVVEIVRAVLAPNTFMLNTILYSNTFEDYFTYQIKDRILNLYLNSNYRTTNLKESYYKHIGWILGNRDISDMVNEIGYNTSLKNQMKFQFRIPNFKFTARVKRTKYGYLVMEIIKVKEKRINFDQIKVFHPSFEKYEKSDKSKKWSYVNLNNNRNNERKIDNEAEGSTRSVEGIKDELTIQEYLGTFEIKKEKTSYINKRQVEDNNTKKFFKEDNNKRTFADEGGQSLDKGIEANSIDIKSINGCLKDFMLILKYLKNIRGIRSVSVKAMELPIVLNRRFAYLSDGITRRKCLIVTIQYLNKEYKIIEVEREGRTLSTLILSGDNANIDWRYAINIILKGVVMESGKWSNDAFEKIKKMGIGIERYKHLKKSYYEKACDIYVKIANYT